MTNNFHRTQCELRLDEPRHGAIYKHDLLNSRKIPEDRKLLAAERERERGRGREGEREGEKLPRHGIRGNVKT